MKKIIALPIFVFILLLVSCDKNNNLNNSNDLNNLNNESTTKIPADSIFFSCVINNQPIKFKSPSAESGSWEKGTTRLMKIKNSTKDSILVSYRKSFHDEHYRVQIGFSETILLDIDTTSLILSVPNQKSLFLRKGIHSIQFLEQGFNYNETTPKYCGFSIVITDLINDVRYSSYVRYRDPNISTEYSDFKSKSSFEITELTELNTGIYKDYINTWFFNSKFHCKLYKNAESTQPVILTNGVINCCF